MSSSTCDPKLVRLKLIVSYDGTRFIGFQRQTAGTDDSNSKKDSDNNGDKKNSSSSSVKPAFFKRRRFESDGRYTKIPLTVQEFIEDALEALSGLTRTTIKLRFAGRTDGGVHARGQVCAISLPEHLLTSGENEEKSISPNTRRCCMQYSTC